MRIRTLYIVFLLLNVNSSFAQDSLRYTWHEKISYPLDSTEVWAVDVLDNFYFSDKGTIIKYDSAGVFKFSQSIKSLGRMTQMVPINTMKLVHFSEEQQRPCYFDNTLTRIGDCLELIDSDIVDASMISTSNRPDKVWVVDNVNSKLVLLSLEGQSQGQEIDNLKGILSIGSISQIIERNNRLYLLDSEKGIYVFDLYGSLIEFRPVEGVKHIDAYDNSMFLLTGTELKIIFLDINDELSIALPKENIEEFTFSNQMFFFRTSTYVHKFALKFDK
ncbi:MAG: hypothetical protein JKY09_06020 [Crocinitomicaceae bacterium]|nr:hypothetical protein [Crocinitomicaceae bacterium]